MNEILGLPIWAWWVILAIALVVLDLSILGAQFILIPTGLAALIAALIAALGGSNTQQIWVFALATLVLTPIIIYLIRTQFSRPDKGPLQKGWAIGREAVIERQGDRLVARIQGDTYPFRLADGGEAKIGDHYVVERMEGITLVLRVP